MSQPPRDYDPVYPRFCIPTTEPCEQARAIGLAGSPSCQVLFNCKVHGTRVSGWADWDFIHSRCRSGRVLYIERHLAPTLYSGSQNRKI